MSWLIQFYLFGQAVLFGLIGLRAFRLAQFGSLDRGDRWQMVVIGCLSYAIAAWFICFEVW